MSYVVSAPEIVGIPVAGHSDLFPVRRVYCGWAAMLAHARENGV